MPLPGMGELILIFGAIVLLFGAKKLPKLGGAIGESIKNFKKGINDETKSLESSEKKESSEENENTPS